LADTFISGVLYEVGGRGKRIPLAKDVFVCNLVSAPRWLEKYF
jgi:hypothetical protein